MKKIVFYCDKCGVEIQGDPSIITTGEIHELCPKCAAELNKLVSEWLTGKPAAKKTRAKKDIDMPKVHALMNAGWSRDKIGVEFGVSGQTISNWLKAEEEYDGED